MAVRLSGKHLGDFAQEWASWGAGAGGIGSMHQGYGPLSRSRARWYVLFRERGRSRSPKSRRTGSRRRSGLPQVLPRRILDLRETFQTVCVSEKELGRIYAMGLSIPLLRNPVLTIRGRSGLLSNVSAHTTDVEQRRCGECLSQGSGRRLTSGLSDPFSKRHTPPPSFTHQAGNRSALMY